MIHIFLILISVIYTTMTDNIFPFLLMFIFLLLLNIIEYRNFNNKPKLPQTYKRYIDDSRFDRHLGD